MRRHGAAVVHDVDVADDDALLAVAAVLGEPTAEGNDDSLIYDVVPRPQATDVSQTAQRFPLHTDSTFLQRPHAFVVLGCQEAPGDAGGASLVVHVDALRDALVASHGEDVLAALCEPQFWFLAREPGEQTTLRRLPVLERSGEDWRVRYRADALARAELAAAVRLAPPQRAALEALEAILADPELPARYALRPGDVLLIDNRRALHGRTAIREGARRVLRRVKLQA